MSEGRERERERETVDLRKFRDEKLEEHELYKATKRRILGYLNFRYHIGFFVIICDTSLLFFPSNANYVAILLLTLFFTFVAMAVINCWMYFNVTEELLVFCYELVIFAEVSNRPDFILLNNDMCRNNCSTLSVKKIHLRKKTELTRFIREKIPCWQRESMEEDGKYNYGMLDNEYPIEALFVIFFGKDNWHPFKIFGSGKNMAKWTVSWFIIFILEQYLWYKSILFASNTFSLHNPDLSSVFLRFILSSSLFCLSFVVLTIREFLSKYLSLYQDLLYFGLK